MAEIFCTSNEVHLLFLFLFLRRRGPCGFTAHTHQLGVALQAFLYFSEVTESGLYYLIYCCQTRTWDLKDTPYKTPLGTSCLIA
jgi:hypothetical protein